MEAGGLDDPGTAVLTRGGRLDLDCEAVRSPPPLPDLSLALTPPGV